MFTAPSPALCFAQSRQASSYRPDDKFAQRQRPGIRHLSAGLLVVMAGFVGITTGPAIAGVGTDERIGQSGVYYVDPELHAPTRRMVWQDFINNDVWVCQIDTQTGRLIPANGKGLRAPVKTIPIFTGATNSGSFNGPELGFSAQGLFTFYTIRDANGVNQTARFGPLDRGTASYRQISADPRYGRSGAIPTQLGNLPNAAILNIYLDRFRGRTGWSYENTPEIKNAIPTGDISLKGPRWIPGEFAISTNVKTESRTKQAAIYDIQSDTLTTITNDSGHKTEVFVFNCPETGTRAAMCLVGNGQRELAVYKEASPFWQKIASIPVPNFIVGGGRLSTARIFLPEPFVFQGKSYFVFVVGRVNVDSLTVDGPSQVFVAQLGRPEAVQVGSSFPAGRIDPEVLVLPDRVYLYYYTVVPPPPETPPNLEPELHVVKDFLPLP
ncbi:MAG: hypothetical protein KF777_14165 [Planctomycetaceae bacterium]|nr:hypothetical protein [Planctomycetaceae bacterium]